MKNIRLICRLLIGLVFIYSGFVKGIDPTGFAYKFHDYFAAFHMNFLQFLDMPLSLFFSSAEFLIGIALVLGFRKNYTSWALLIFMSFFTILTFILALFNPVSDCGCFGDALILTNWQTFEKNIILMGLTLVIFIGRNRDKQNSNTTAEWLLLAFALSGFLLVMNYCLNHLPIIDFRPYKAGTNLIKDMSRPEGAPQDSFKTMIYYKKNGEFKEIILGAKDISWPDTTWKWVETKNILLKEGYHAPIHDFSIKSFEGNDITNQVLNDHDYSFLLITRDLSRADKKAFDKANAIAEYCKTGKCKFYALTSSSAIESDSLKKSRSLSFDFYTTDGTTLKTMNRSNPGLMLIRDGIVISQWHYNDFPSPAEMGDNLMAYTISVAASDARQLTGWHLVLLVICTLLSFRIIILKIKK